MRAVILMTQTGNGHLSAAKALCGYLGDCGCETVVADVLNSGKKNVSSGISRFYDRLVLHAPWLFGLLYYTGALVSSPRRHSPIYYLNSIYSGTFCRKLNELKPDVVICTHIFSAQALTRLREKGLCGVPAIGIMTDYTCSPFWEETRLDSYVIPSPLLRLEFEGKGIPPEKILPCGIPVDPCFRDRTDRQTARQKLGITEQTVFTVMGGSMGYGGVLRVCRELTKHRPEARVMAVCGHNEKLRASLSDLQNVTALAYTDSIHLLMKASDVIVTKPGGLSSTEAAVSRVPIVFLPGIPGGESRNSAFFTSLGMAAAARTPREAARMACEIAGDARRAQAMSESQRVNIIDDADRRIGDMVLKLAGEGRPVRE